MTLNKTYLVAFYIFISSMDIPSLVIGGATIRISWIFLPLLIGYSFSSSILLPQKAYRNLIIFLITLIPSLYFSLNTQKSFLYIFWVVFNFFAFYAASFKFGYDLGENFFYSIILCFRVHILIGFIFVLLGFTQRISSFFYEPAYLSIAMIPYLCLILIRNQKISKIDYVLLGINFLLGMSAIFLVLIIIISILKLILNKKISYFFIFILLLLLYIYCVDDINTEFIRSVFSNLDGNTIYQLIMRGGNRFPRLLQSLEVIKEYWITGCGVGAYEAALDQSNSILTDYADVWYLTPVGMPATNIYLEIFATCGIGSFIFVVLLTCRYVWKIQSSEYTNKIFILILISLIIFVMQIESNYLRAYIWIYVGGISGVMYKYKTTIINENKIENDANNFNSNT